VIPLAAGETGEGAMRRLIMHSMRLLMDHTSTIFSVEYLDFEQSTNNSSSDPRKPLGALVRLPARLSLHNL